MSKKLMIMLLTLAVVTAMSVPAFAGTTAQKSGSSQMGEIVLYNNNSPKESEVPYTDPNNVVANVKVPCDSMVNIEGDCNDIVLYTDSGLTNKVTSVDYNTWIVSAGTYYAKISLFDESYDEDDTSHIVTVSGKYATAEDVDLNTISKNQIYAFGMDKTTYAKFVPSKSGCWLFDHAYALCDVNKTVISETGTGCGYWLEKGTTYYFEINKQGIESPEVSTIDKPSYKKCLKVGTSLKEAKKLKAINITKSERPMYYVGFKLGHEGTAKWFKIKTTRSELQVIAAGYGMMKGSCKAQIYNSRGKAVTKVSTGKYVSKKLKKGTYYVKVTKGSDLATGAATILLGKFS